LLKPQSRSILWLNINWDSCIIGKSVIQDYAKALKWFQEAAEPGSAMAQYYLVIMNNVV